MNAAVPAGGSAAAAVTGARGSRRPACWLKRVLIRHVAPEAAFVVLTLLRASWRVHETGREHYDRATASGRGPVMAFLHGRAVMLLNTIRGRRRRRWLSMCSKSLDGDGMTRLEERLGFEVIRGSSGRDGLQAIIDMIRLMRDTPGLGACLAVDGSRGPRGVVQGGIISLAQRTGGMIVPVTISASPAWIFRKSWDRTLLAMPFARVEIVFGEPVEVPPKMKAPEFKRHCASLGDGMIALQATADRLSGFGDTVT
ncbi:MAG: DUF374 domain-containing protein [Opitutaceae bacterium]|nr:DUF374 domain-containing protein [Opitutaceae bacterium]